MKATARGTRNNIFVVSIFSETVFCFKTKTKSCLSLPGEQLACGFSEAHRGFAYLLLEFLVDLQSQVIFELLSKETAFSSFKVVLI